MGYVVRILIDHYCHDRSLLRVKYELNFLYSHFTVHVSLN